MNKILITAYAINPYKGSEDGTGWNIVSEVARHNQVIAITRKNNREAIERYLLEQPKPHYSQLSFLYYDLPKWARFWKRKSRGAMLYFYLWQLFLPLFVLHKKVKFDIAHGLNFHTDWVPSFLWILGKPFIWGPIGHHPPIPKDYLNHQKGHSNKIKDQLKWGVKNVFYKLDIFLRIAVHKADYIFTVNRDTANRLPLKTDRWEALPAVGAVPPKQQQKTTRKQFNVLSVGRFVPLKGFDLTLQSFLQFYQSLRPEDQQRCSLTLVGKGPMKKELEDTIQKANLGHIVQLIEWMPQEQLFALFAKANLFLFPSHEGAGMVIPEALSYGIPVLCLNNFGPGELINASCGIAIEYTTYDPTIRKLADTLSMLYKSPDQLQCLSEGATQRFKEHFDWKVKGRRIHSIYNRVLDQKTSVAPLNTNNSSVSP